MTRLSETPLIHPTAVVSDARLGRYTEIDENCRVSETELGDYSYLMNGRSVGLIHSLPLKRQTLFFTQLLTGFAMAFARAIGEYGSVIFIAGNMPMVSEITPLIIIGKLEQYDYAGATAVAVVMLLFSFIMLLVINALQAWQRRHAGMPA